METAPDPAAAAVEEENQPITPLRRDTIADIPAVIPHHVPRPPVRVLVHPAACPVRVPVHPAVCPARVPVRPVVYHAAAAEFPEAAAQEDGDPRMLTRFFTKLPLLTASGADVGIIGGADGPTAVFIAGEILRPMLYLFGGCIAAAILISCVIFAIRRFHRK